MQIFKYAIMQIFKYASMQTCKFAGLQVVTQQLIPTGSRVIHGPSKGPCDF